MKRNLATPMLLVSGALFLIGAKSASGRSPVANLTTKAIERQIHILTNRERVRSGMRALAADRRLTAAAREHSARMAAKGFFSHDDPHRGDLQRRIERAGIGWTMIAENISFSRNARATPSQIARDAVKRWMQSPGHADNLLEDRFAFTGIGVANARNGGVYMTQIFLRR